MLAWYVMAEGDLINCQAAEPQKEASRMSEVIHEMSSGVGLAWDTGWALSFTALISFCIHTEALRFCTAT